jgi:hypothetical protein
MNKHCVLTAAVLGLGLVSGQAWAESEGNGARWAFQATPQTAQGLLPTTDVGSKQHPAPANSLGEAPSLAQLEPARGSEAPVQTANSLLRDHASARAVSVGSASYQEVGTLPQYG